MSNVAQDNFFQDDRIVDQFGAMTESHRVAIEQIQHTYLGHRPHCKVLDLGAKEGMFLQKLHALLPLAELTGVDVSADALNKIKVNLPLTTIEASPSDVTHYLPPHSQDLVLAHFLNAYVPLHTLFNAAKVLTRATGYFSLVTTTYESFPVAQQYLADFITKGSVLGRVVGHYYKSIVKNTTVAASEEDLLKACASHGFEVIEHHRLKIPIVLHNIDELAWFGIEGTWFLNHLSVRMLPKHFLIARLKRLFDKVFTFPYQDIHMIDVILARKSIQ